MARKPATTVGNNQSEDTNKSQEPIRVENVDPNTPVKTPDPALAVKQAKRAQMTLNWLTTRFDFNAVKRHGKLVIFSGAYIKPVLNTKEDDENLQAIHQDIIVMTETQLARWWVAGCELQGDGMTRDEAMEASRPKDEE